MINLDDKENVKRGKEVYFQIKCSENNKKEIRPYFFVPKPNEMPNYLIMIDSGLQMNKHKEKLIQSLKRLCDFIFQLQPNARIQVQYFHENVCTLDEYSENNCDQLIQKIEGLSFDYASSQFSAISSILSEIRNSKKPMVAFLLTSGINNTYYNPYTPKPDDIREQIEKMVIKNPSTVFHILNYGFRAANDVIEEAALCFGGCYVDNASPESFGDLQNFKKWIAVEETYSVAQVKIGKNNETIKTRYTLSVNLSSQIEYMKSISLLPEESLSITISNSNNDVVLKGEFRSDTPVQHLCLRLFSQPSLKDAKEAENDQVNIYSS
jgi:hypothetical protein